MKLGFVLLMAAAFLIKSSTAFCCSRVLQPLCPRQPSCFCLAEPIVPGIVSTCCDTYGTCPTCNCFKNVCDPCSSCCEVEKPACSCLKSLDDDACGCDKLKSFIYFPEVEYPVTLLESLGPYFYGSCFSY